MSDRIVSINGRALPTPGDPHEPLVRLLESLLEHARSGEIVGIMAACTHADKSASRSRAGFLSYSTVGTLALLQKIALEELTSDE